jgi:hypothetical protein
MAGESSLRIMAALSWMPYEGLFGLELEKQTWSGREAEGSWTFERRAERGLRLITDGKFHANILDRLKPCKEVVISGKDI